MIRWKIYKDLFVNPSCLTDIMDIQVRIKTHSIYTQFINGPVPPLLERVEFGAYRKVIGSNGKKNGYIYFEYGIGELDPDMQSWKVWKKHYNHPEQARDFYMDIIEFRMDTIEYGGGLDKEWEEYLNYLEFNMDLMDNEWEDYKIYLEESLWE